MSEVGRTAGDISRNRTDGHSQSRGHARSERTVEPAQCAAEEVGTQAPQASQAATPRVIDLLRRYAPTFLSMFRVSPQVQSVLAKILLCRTATLKGHIYECPECRWRCNVYNSCADRHCPLCSGARRADWLDKTRMLLLPGVNYFQVVFTLPDEWAPLILGNRKALYDLLFCSAWRSLEGTLRTEGQFQPAAAMVLHTSNQELGFHPHLHVIVPGGGPALDGGRWVAARHPTEQNRRKPYLTDNIELGRVFRQKFTDGLRRLAHAGKLKLQDEWARLRDRRELDAWLDAMTASDWNVFIQGPPHGQSRPEDVLKYLARYLTGGPISDRRILRDEQGRITFWARSKDKAKGNPSRPFPLPGKEFVRRWAMHILPKGYTRSRHFGGYHSRQRAAYLASCRALLAKSPPVAAKSATERPAPAPAQSSPLSCPRCGAPLRCLERQRRPSWKFIFARSLYDDPSLYSPMHHICSRGPPAFPPDE